MKSSIRLIALFLCCLLASQASATVTQTIGAGSAVSIADRTATFDGIVDGVALANYAEAGLDITTSGVAYVGFDFFNDGFGTFQLFYPSGGNSDWASIKTSDNLPIFALEAKLGSGFADAALYISWQTWSGGVMVDSGSFEGTKGDIGGWSDPAGFDEIRIGAYLAPDGVLGTFQALAMDDVKVATKQVLLGVNSGAGGQFLATIDVDTAALTNLGNTGLTIDGIAMGNGILYAADNGNGRLVTLDPQSGALDIVIGDFVNATQVEAMAYRASDNALFGVDINNGNFVSFDTSTGEAAVVGPLGAPESLAGMSFSGDGTLYSIGHSSGSLYTINPATGVATLVATGTGIGPLGLAIHPVTDVLYTASWTGGSDMLLETVDPATAVRTLVGTMVGGQQIEGLTFWGGSVAVPLADLTISKTDGADPVTAGTELTYTIHVDNTGDAPADNVVVTDNLPAGLTLVSTSGCAEDPAGNPDCNLGTIASGGSAEFTVTVLVDPSVTGLITNNVSVTTSSTESNTANNSATQDTTVVAEADLSITKMDSSDPIISGGNQLLVYTIEVSNAGPSDATNVLVTDTLPAIAIFQSTSGCQNDPVGVPVCQLGTIAAGDSASYTITVMLQRAGGTISNSVSVTSDASDPTAGNDSVVETTEVTPIPIPTLNTLGMLLLMMLLTGFAWVSIRRT